MNPARKSDAAMESNALSCLLRQNRTDNTPVECYLAFAPALDESGINLDCSESSERLCGTVRKSRMAVKRQLIPISTMACMTSS